MSHVEILRAALKALVAKHPHHGSCCTFDFDGKVIVTEQSCVCEPVEKQARIALRATEDRPVKP